MKLWLKARCRSSTEIGLGTRTVEHILQHEEAMPGECRRPGYSNRSPIDEREPCKFGAKKDKGDKKLPHGQQYPSGGGPCVPTRKSLRFAFYYPIRFFSI